MRRVLILLPTTALVAGLILASPTAAVYRNGDPTPGPGYMRTLQDVKDPILKSRLATREARVAEKKTRVQNHRRRIEEKRASISADIKARREAFREKLARIRDERKQKILENLTTRYAHINERWTTHFLNVLDRLLQILDKLKTRIEQNPDLNSEQTALLIADARSAISTAQETVENQAAKVYTINITDETSLREDAKAMHKTLRADLAEARETVKQARQSVIEVFRSLHKSP